MQRHSWRAITLAASLFSNSLLIACPADQVPRTDEDERDSGPSQPVDEPGRIDVVITAPAALPLGAALTLDGSGSSEEEGRLLTYAWSVSAPEGDGCAPELGDTALATLTFTPLCAGPHDVTLTASTVEGKHEQARVQVEVVEVSVSFGEIVPAPRGRSAEVFVEVEHGALPSDALTTVLEATPRAPFTDVPEITGDGNPFLVPMLDPLASYDLVARVMADDVVVSEDASATVTALNTAPVVSNLRLDPGPLEIGGTTTLLADVSDAEGDTVTCEAHVTAGDATGFSITPATVTPEAGACAFTLSAPARLEQWTVTVTADDGNATSLPATLDVQPENEPPSLSVTVEGPTSGDYACAAPGTCTSAAFTLVLAMSDDIDPNEALDVAIESDDAELPEGVSLVVEPHATDAAKRLVRFTRDSYGPLAGVFPLTVTVTEATALDGLVASTSQTVELAVTNLAPTGTPSPQFTGSHTYTAADGYRGEIRFLVAVSDPEANALALTSTVVSCPTAATGEAACGGAELELELVEATLSGGAAEVTYEVRSSTLVALVGPYTVDLHLSDPDGGTLSLSGLTSEIGNRAPTFVASRAVHHSYSGGQYRASFSALFADPDGDPLTTDLQVRCPGGQTVALGQGCNGSTPIVSLSGADVSITSAGGSTSGFLGAYGLQGTISDGVETRGAPGTTLSTLTVRNRAPGRPSLVSATSRLECDHETTSGTVTNDPACAFLITASGTDPDGDPARLRLRTDAPFAFGDASATPLTTTTPRSRSFDLTVPFDHYKSDQVATVRAYLEDGFGEQGAEVPIDVELLNRAPVWGNASVMTPRKMQSIYGILETRGVAWVGSNITEKYEDFDRWQDTIEHLPRRAFGPKPCVFGNCGSEMPFTLTLDVSDPDGDPLEVLPLITCTGSKSPMLGTQPLGAWHPMRETFNARFVWSDAYCNSDDVMVDVVPLAGSILGMRCTLNNNSAASDGIAATYIPAAKVRMWRVPGGSPETGCE